ncbi:prolyl oligopeptidase family serine peptidase [Terriglobus sp. ADX1]|uniref:prolyl oligopeptidase family serine peptidase n=1 Tax=Terriglobus sp. ADX1 TaxID=2794063 RepID=UPI002FE65D3A
MRRILQDDGRPSIRFNPQGTAAAYLVQVPNLASNVNDVRLDLAPVGAGAKDAQHLFVGTDVSGLQWTDDGHAIALLAKRGDHVVIMKISVPGAHVSVLARIRADIAEFSISNDGKTLALAVNEPRSTKLALPSPEDEARGYRIPFERTQTSLRAKRRIYVLRKTRFGWTHPMPVHLRLPNMEGRDTFPFVLNLRLSISPNGEYLLFTYFVDAADAPKTWRSSATVRSITTTAGGVELMPVLNLKTGTATLPFEGPWALIPPSWSPDSASFVVTANSPANSRWDQEDERQHRAVMDATHLFEIRAKEGTVRLVRSDLHGFYGRPAFWSNGGDLLLRTGDGELTHMQQEGDQWQEGETVRLPSAPGQFKMGELASNGSVVVGDFETPSVAPSLFVYSMDQRLPQQVIPLNEQFNTLTLAPYRLIHWKTSTGFRATGYLYMPPNYDPHRAYPLVIHAYPAASNFFCDSGFNHMPSFAPQPIANAGMLYLIRIYTDGARQTDEQEHAPPGYPGQLSEAAFQTDVWDSAVDQLAAEGIVDPHKVGVIGFSRSGWYTEFALTHGRTKYAAATVADNVQYSLGEYWLIHSSGTLQGYDAMYGGPPYGDSLNNWLDHSISFNLQKIQAPILMEVMGYGVHYTDVDTAPSNIVLKTEVFTGLNRLGKPVEMYYYPLENHQPDDPLARLASLQRNLDWYAFWLEDVERPGSVDPQQYVRWRALRKARMGE